MAHHQRGIINPGPEDPSLLYLQGMHVSERVWNSNLNRILQTRRVKQTSQIAAPPPEIIDYLTQAGFYGVARLFPFNYDRALVSALVERWRPETHTFHTTRGECTITLEDVSIQLGLSCEGYNVIGDTRLDWFSLCEVLLGIRPPEDKLQGQRLKISWLDEHFQELPQRANDDQVQQFTRAYILKLIGGFLMPDRSGNRVYLMYLQRLVDLPGAGQYSWGSVVLAHLYRELCNATNPEEINIGGCLGLLHMWAWDRFPMIAPERPLSPDPQSHIYNLLPPLGFRWQRVRHRTDPSEQSLIDYRALFDRMAEEEIIWQPYKPAEVQQLIPDYCRQGSELWQASVPLICFYIVEWHHPDRVLRQFGRGQPIPRPPICLQNVHSLELRGRTDVNWMDCHEKYILLWLGWSDAIANAPPAHDPLPRTSAYMQWYWRYTRRWIHPTTGNTGCAADIAEQLYRLMINDRERCFDCVDLRDRVAEDQRNILRALREPGSDVSPQPFPLANELPRPEIPDERQSRRRRSYLSTQPPIVQEDVPTHEGGTSSTQPYSGSPPSSSYFQTPPDPPYTYQTQPFSSLFHNYTSFFSDYNNPSTFDPGGPSHSSFVTPRQSVSLSENPSTFDPGGPSHSSFITPRQSVSLSETPWFFNSHASSTLQINEPSQTQQNDPSQQQQQQPQQQRPRRVRPRTRCGTGSHYF